MSRYNTKINLDPLPIAVSPLHVDVKSIAVPENLKVKNLGEEISKNHRKKF